MSGLKAFNDIMKCYYCEGVQETIILQVLQKQLTVRPGKLLTPKTNKQNKTNTGHQLETQRRFAYNH